MLHVCGIFYDFSQAKDLFFFTFFSHLTWNHPVVDCMLHDACCILHGRDTAGKDLPHVGVFVEHAEDLHGKGEGRSFYTLAV